MEEFKMFKKDLVALFEKYNLRVDDNALSISISPLYIPRIGAATRKVTFEFIEIINPLSEKAIKLCEKYGAVHEV